VLPRDTTPLPRGCLIVAERFPAQYEEHGERLEALRARVEARFGGIEVVQFHPGVRSTRPELRPWPGPVLVGGRFEIELTKVRSPDWQTSATRYLRGLGFEIVGLTRNRSSA
jgi:hypothetical protein